MNFLHCNSNVIQSSNTIEFCMDRENKNFNIEKKHLSDLTGLCWNLYSHRLRETSDTLFEAGEVEFKVSNSVIIDKILEVDIPWKIGLSVTRDGSLHYTFRFKDMVLFIATYLYLDEENHTYIEFFKDDDLRISGHYPLDAGLELFKRQFNKIKEEDYSGHVPSDTFRLDLDTINCD